MLADIPWNAALIGSPTQHLHLPEIMAKKIISFVSTSQATQKDEAPKETGKASPAAASFWERVWNRPPTQGEYAKTSVKHPQLPQYPQHPHPAVNENSSPVNLPDQADHIRLYKWAPSSRGKESTDRSRRDYFSGSSPSFSSKRPH